MNRCFRNYSSQTGPPKLASLDRWKPVWISIETKELAKPGHVPRPALGGNFRNLTGSEK